MKLMLTEEYKSLLDKRQELKKALYAIDKLLDQEESKYTQAALNHLHNKGIRPGMTFSIYGNQWKFVGVTISKQFLLEPGMECLVAVARFIRGEGRTIKTRLSLTIDFWLERLFDGIDKPNTL